MIRQDPVLDNSFGGLASIIRPRQIGESYYLRRVSKEKEKLIIGKPCSSCKAVGMSNLAVAGFHSYNPIDSDPYPSFPRCQEHLNKMEELQISIERLHYRI